MIFNIDDREYMLNYTMKKVEQIESTTGHPLMATMVSNKGMLGLSDLKVYIALGLKPTEEGNGRPSLQQGLKYAEALIEEDGYVKLLEAVTEALQKDCPFFFIED